MKNSLQLKISQQLTMTPQLQQAIKLLQLSSLDLELEIQKQLESNLMLEIVDDNNICDNVNENNIDKDTSISDNTQNSTFDNMLGIHDNKKNEDNVKNKLNEKDIPLELSLDTDWTDIYQDHQYSFKKSSSNVVDGLDIESNYSVATTLKEHLIWQLNLSQMTEIDKIIGNVIIDSIDESGYLTSDIDEIYETIVKKYSVEYKEVLSVLHKIQQFEPIGVGSRDLKECLLIQINLLPNDDYLVAKAKVLIENYLDLLAKRNVSRLTSRLQVKECELKEIVSIIKSLCPKPGDLFNKKELDYIIPDLVVYKNNNKWLVKLNEEKISKIRINPSYAAIARKSKTTRENKFLQEQLNEAKWFIKSIQNRQDTLLKVARCIVDMQEEFLEEGVVKIKPMILYDVAQVLDLHESTISRVTTEKYIHTPYGVYELKYFFSSFINTDNGDKCSSKAICALIKNLIENEQSSTPLSDLKIAKILAKKGFVVARRTVAKYRDSMKILSSSKRKKFEMLGE